MCIQFSENLFYQGEWHNVYTTPLEEYFDRNNNRPDLKPCNTALMRGYVADWEIADDKLYLTGVEGYLEKLNVVFGVHEPLTLQHIFPEAKEKVWAQWYSGTLICPKGKRLTTVFVGKPWKEYDLLIEVKNGVVQASTLRKNPLPPPEPERNYDIPDFLLSKKPS